MKVTWRRLLKVIFFIIISVWVSSGATIRAADPYDKGKTIKFLVSSPPGGGTDTVARLVSGFLPNYLPGTPQNIVTILREAYQKMIKDRGFNVHANRFLGDAWFTRGGEKTSAMVKQSTAMSKEVRNFSYNIRKKNGLSTERVNLALR